MPLFGGAVGLAGLGGFVGLEVGAAGWLLRVLFLFCRPYLYDARTKKSFYFLH